MDYKEWAQQVVGKTENSPFYDAKEMEAARRNTEEASKMTWEQLKAQSESCV